MKQFNAAEWQFFSLKKVVEKIDSKISYDNFLKFAILFELGVAILGAALSNMIIEQKGLRILWICLSAAGIFFIVLPFIILGVKSYIDNSKRRGNGLTNKEFADIFDNRICYHIFTAQSYCSMLNQKRLIPLKSGYAKSEKSLSLLHLPISADPNALQFYYIEAAYYVNKAVDELSPMGAMCESVLDSDVTCSFTPSIDKRNPKNEKLISTARYFNAYNLISKIYKTLHDYENIINDLEGKEVLQKTIAQGEEIISSVHKLVSEDLNSRK